MLTTISLSTAAVFLVLGVLLHVRARGKSRLAYLALVVGGFGIMASSAGTVIYKVSAVITETIQGALKPVEGAPSRDIAQAVPTAIALIALAFVVWAVLDGEGSLLTAVLAVALPTLLFNVDGQLADGAKSLLALVQSLIYGTADGLHGGITAVTR